MTAITTGTQENTGKPLADRDWRDMPLPGTTRVRAIVEPAAGGAASGVRMTLLLGAGLVAASNVVLRQVQPTRVTLPEDPARERWLRLKRAHFTPEGRQARIEAGLRALEHATAKSPLDGATIRWIAEDADLEDL